MFHVCLVELICVEKKQLQKYFTRFIIKFTSFNFQNIYTIFMHRDNAETNT